jgi:O-antigen biosynthesis protein WbqP
MKYALKRTFDIVSGALGIVVLSPVLVILVLIIRLESAGSGIFAQRRVGKNGRVFTCLKLRTMMTGTKQTGTHEVGSSSITRVGRCLRSSKLDEVPQLWNVLKGEMSLVGPRPCLPMQVKLIGEREERGVLEVLPGITGLAQVEGIDMSDPVRLAERDADYVRGQSFWLDMKILFWTVLGKGRGDRVREQQGD